MSWVSQSHESSRKPLACINFVTSILARRGTDDGTKSPASSESRLTGSSRFIPRTELSDPRLSLVTKRTFYRTGLSYR